MKNRIPSDQLRRAFKSLKLAQPELTGIGEGYREKNGINENQVAQALKGLERRIESRCQETGGLIEISKPWWKG